MSDGNESLKLKLKVPAALSATLLAGSEQHAQQREEALLIGARGGAAVKELLTTAPNIEVAIRDFQTAHGVAEAHTQIAARKSKRAKRSDGAEDGGSSFSPSVQLLDLLTLRRSSMYSSLLDQLLKEMLLRIQELPQSELQRVLEATFPYIEFRELRAIPIAILSRQEDTPEAYLRELTENRRILAELPVHVRRKILQVDRQELQLFVDECTKEYIADQLAWYTKHPFAGAKSAPPMRRKSSASLLRKRSSGDLNADNLWNVTSHVPTSTGTTSPASATSAFTAAGERRPSYSPEDRRHHSASLAKLTEMLGESEELYHATLEIWKEYVVAANIPGAETHTNPKEYVDYVPFLGAMRADLANLQRDKTTSLLRVDPLHKFIWFLDKALKSHTLEITQLHELLGFVGKLRTGDLPPNKKFKKTSVNGGAGEIQEEEENFEVVLGPPPVDELLSVLDKIAKIDARMIFAEPVPDDVPKYREIISEPMDLSTMRKKAKKAKYKTVDAFVDDFNLMIRNCLTFNPDTTIFYKEAKRIAKRGNELIEKHTTALRGEPQRIRAKKRRKSGPGETIAMLTSSGVASLKDFGDVDQSGMVPEGICDESLADVAMILSDPHVKQLLCEALMRKLVICWQRQELPTDNLTCRALVELLQIGNPASVRRMIRKNDFVLRAPQVVTMRVALPLLLRAMVSFRVMNGFPGVAPEVTDQQDILNQMLWQNVLRASSAIRSITKSFAVQCLVYHQTEACAKLLHYLLGAEDYLLLRDRVLLHALGESVIEQFKAAITSNTGSTSDDAVADAKESGEIVADLCDRLSALPVSNLILNGFFVEVLSERTRTAKVSGGGVVEVGETDELWDDNESERPAQSQQRVIKSFPVHALHEKTAMILASLFEMLERAEPSKTASVMLPYVTKTLGELRKCVTLEEFELLWNSSLFAVCRGYYDTILTKCPSFRHELFQADELPVGERSTAPVESTNGTGGTTQATNGNGELVESSANEDEKEPAEVSSATEDTVDAVDAKPSETVGAEPMTSPEVVVKKPLDAADGGASAAEKPTETPEGDDENEMAVEVQNGDGPE